MPRSLIMLLIAVLAVSWVPGRAAGQYASPPGSLNTPMGPETTPEEYLDIGVDEKLNNPVPADLRFVDETGRTVALGDYLNRGRPVVLQMGYFQCPMLCGMVSQGLVDAVKDLSLTPGQEYEILYVSIDAREGAPLAYKKKGNLVEAMERPESAGGLHLLTGQEPSIKALADAVGFRYRWNEKQQQFAHAAVLILLTPDGRVARYLYGVNFTEKGDNLLRLSIVEASDGKVGSIMDQLILSCFQYDAHSGSYSLAAMKLMRLGGFLSLLVVAGGLIWVFRWDRRRQRIERIRALDRADESSGRTTPGLVESDRATRPSRRPHGNANWN